MLIERELTISNPFLDALDIHPRAYHCDQPPCQTLDGGHRFFIKVEAVGFTYEICGRCGTVRIKEQLR